MKKSTIKWIVLGAILVIGIAVAVVLSNRAAKEEARNTALENIDWTVKELFVYSSPSDEDIERIKKEIKVIAETPWMDEEFKTQAVTAIGKVSFSTTYGISMDCFWIKEDMLLLEETGYKCPEIKTAYEEMLLKTFELLENSMGAAETAEDALGGPNDEEEIYNKTLSYYRDPKSIFLEDYLPGYFDKNKNETSTETLLNVCNTAGIAGRYADISGLVDLDAVLTALTTGAEEITVKEGEGFYGDETNSTDSSYKKDEIWEENLPGDYIHSKFKSVKYYGDLASYYSEVGGIYKDEQGKVHGNTATTNSTREVHLKGERISWDGIKESDIKHAREEGMVSYHKDGFCFAISDTAVTCFVGQHFYHVFAN